MLNIQISDLAKNDLRSIQKYTVESYDEEQSDRYINLIDRAFDDIAKEPKSVVARRIHRPGQELYVRPLTASKRPGITNVQTPRHVIVYTLEFEGIAYILRVLHDSMDITRQLEPDTE